MVKSMEPSKQSTLGPELQKFLLFLQLELGLFNERCLAATLLKFSATTRDQDYFQGWDHVWDHRIIVPQPHRCHQCHASPDVWDSLSFVGRSHQFCHMKCTSTPIRPKVPGHWISKIIYINKSVYTKDCDFSRSSPTILLIAPPIPGYCGTDFTHLPFNGLDTWLENIFRTASGLYMFLTTKYKRFNVEVFPFFFHDLNMSHFVIFHSFGPSELDP